MGIEQSEKQKKEKLEIEYKIENVEFNDIDIFSYINLKSNSKYLAGQEKVKPKKLELFSIHKNKNFSLNYKTQIKCNEDIYTFDFHPKYQNLLLLPLASGKIKLYEIKESNNMNYKILSTINAYDSFSAYNCIFNPEKEEIFLSSSNEEIKIFNLNSYTYIQNSHYSYDKRIMKWKSDKEYAYCDNKGIIIKDVECHNDKISISINENINDFYFINKDNLITIEQKFLIKKWDIKKSNSYIQEFKPTESIKFSLFDKNFNYLYLFDINGYIKIFDLKKFKCVNRIECKESLQFYDPILLNDNLLNQENHEIANILYNNKKIINLKKIKDYPTFNIEKQTIASKDFIKSIKTVISDYYDILRETENISIDQDEKIEKKKYMDNKEIKSDKIIDIKNTIYNLEKVYGNNINEIINKFQDSKINNINDMNDNYKKKIKELYIDFINLLIKVDTNKKFVINYLNFLEKNQNILIGIKYLYIEFYKDELEYYKIMFNSNEFLQYFKQNKIAEKVEFINLLENLLNIYKECISTNKLDELSIFIREIREKEIKKLVYFNTPIPFDNDELFYYKMKANIYHYLKTMNLYKEIKDESEKIKTVPNMNLIKLQSYAITKILKDKYFDNETIIKNKDKMNILIYLILYPESESLIDYILNLLTSNKLDKIDKEYIDKLKPNNKEIIYENVCIKNLDLNAKISLKNKEIYNYDYQIELYSGMIKDIKDFLKEILNTPVFDEAFKILYGIDFENIFKDKTFRDYYIDNYVKFVPYKSYNSSAFTDKYTLKSYIFLKKRIINYKTEEKNIKSLIREALKIGSFIDVIIHEINHFVYALLFMSDKFKTNSFQTPRKKKLSDIREGGYYLELLLFGKIINNLSFKEVLYLLNKNNYDKSLKDFKNGFTYLKQKDLEATGKFQKFNEYNELIVDDIEWANSSIAVKNIRKSNLLDDINIECYKKNCTFINRNINLNELKKFEIINN